MTEKILVPVLGESITEATISKWLKSKGESIDADEPIVELETDKVNIEVPSPIDGTLAKINFKKGDVVEVGAILGEISAGTVNTKEVTPFRLFKNPAIFPISPFVLLLKETL